jgi:hypothetical protein
MGEHERLVADGEPIERRGHGTRRGYARAIARR